MPMPLYTPFNPRAGKGSETLDLKKAFEDSDEGRPGSEEALTSLAASYEDPGEAPESPLEEGGLTALANIPSEGDKAEGEKGRWEKMGGWGGLAKGIVDSINVGMETGVGKNMLEDSRNRQKVQLARRQRAWTDAYEASKELPREVLEDPEFAELAKAAAAFQKDMADGTLDNQKTMTEFQSQLALHKEELDAISQENEQTLTRDAYENDLSMKSEVASQRASQAEQILKNPALAEQLGMSVQEAQAIMAEKDKYITSEDGTVRLRSDLENEKYRAAQISNMEEDNALRSRDQDRRDQEFQLQRQRFQQTQDTMSLFNMANAYNQSVGAAIENATRLAKPDIEMGMTYEEREGAQLDAVARATEERSEQIMTMGEALGTVRPMHDVGENNGVQLIQVEGSQELLEYPSDQVMDQIQAKGQEAAQKIQALESGAPPSPGGLVESRAGGSFGIDSIESAKAELEKIQQAYQEALKARADAHKAIHEANQRKQMQIRK